MHWNSTLRLGPDRPSGARRAGAEWGPVGPVRGEWGWGIQLNFAKTRPWLQG